MKMPGAELRLLPPGVNHSSGGMGVIHGVIIHVIVGSLAAADSVFHNPSYKASAHFGVGKDGHVVQWVDTNDKAWAEAAGNPNWISVETEGQPSEALTEQQLDSCARIARWVHDTYNSFPLQVTDSPYGLGIGTHSMGGAAWGGHACPGDIRAGQRSEIVRRAVGVPQPQPKPQEDQMKGVIIQCDINANRAKNAEGWFFAICNPKPVKWHVPTIPMADFLFAVGHASNNRPAVVPVDVYDFYQTV